MNFDLNFFCQNLSEIDKKNPKIIELLAILEEIDQKNSDIFLYNLELQKENAELKDKLKN